jgi:hypothetical protein
MYSLPHDDILHKSSGDDRIKYLSKSNAKYQTVTNLSHSAIGNSSRRLPIKNQIDSKKQFLNFGSLEGTPGSAAATETVMFLKQ